MTRYAQNTGVSVERSKGEIERLLRRYGANQFVNGWDHKAAMIMFRAHERMIRFTLPLPSRDEFKETATGRERHPGVVEEAWERACRQRWRALALVIKAKLEAVESGISEFEQEFYAFVVLPNGRTMYETTREQVQQMYASNRMKALLPEWPTE
jgi:hypothetical protein